MLNHFFVTGVMLAIMSCSSQNKSQLQKDVATEKLNISNRENAQNKIVFVTLQMTRVDSIKDTYKFEVKNTVFAEGSLTNNSFSSDAAFEPYSLYCEVADENNKRMYLVKVQNPLMKVFEYSPDKQALEKKLFTSNTGELFLRFQINKSSKYLNIYKPGSDFKTLKKIYHGQI